MTDILVSPKYEDGDTTEEEDSDDTVYECPGLAKGAGLEVRNPFFLDGDLQPSTGRLANKKPISQYTDLFHHQEIASLNWSLFAFKKKYPLSFLMMLMNPTEISLRAA